MSLYIDKFGHENKDAPNLVLIHGWGMHGGVWQPIVKKLSKYFCVHVVDLPGMGFSRPIEPADLNAVAEKVAEVLPENADICGWSLGGLIAMRIAISHPERMRRLVLIGSTPKFINSSDWHDGMDAEVFEKFAEGISHDYQATLIKFLTLQCMRSDDARATVKQLRTTFAERPVPTLGSLQKALRILMESDLRSELQQLQKPTLLIHGDRDNLAPLQAAQWLAQSLPFGRLRVLAGASHAPFLSHSEHFIDALVQFLEPVPVAVD